MKKEAADHLMQIKAAVIEIKAAESEARQKQEADE